MCLPFICVQVHPFLLHPQTHAEHLLCTQPVDTAGLQLTALSSWAVCWGWRTSACQTGPGWNDLERKERG